MVNSEQFPEKPVEKPGRKQTLAQSDEVVMRTLDFISESSILTESDHPMTAHLLAA